MKNKKWITLLSVALGATVVLAACSDKDEDAYKVPTAAPTVEAKFENFIKAEYKVSGVNYEQKATSLTKEYGTFVQASGRLYLFRDEDRTPLGEKEIIWTLYDAEEQEAVWTKSYTYQEGDYEGKDEYGNDKHVPLEVNAEIIKCDSKMSYVQVSLKEYRKYTSEEMQAQIDMALKGVLDEEDGFKSYEVTTTYEYYTADGKYICTLSNDLDEDQIDDWDATAYLFGRMCVRVDEDGKTVEIWNVETTDRIAYEMESKDYVYTEAMRNGEYMLDVYSKKDSKLIYSYALDTMSQMTGGVLQDGDLLIQTIKTTYGSEYSYMQSGTKFLVETRRIDVETGKTVVLDFPYVINDLMTKEDFAEELADELTLTDNVYNVAAVSKIANGEITTNNWGEPKTTGYLFFDNLGNIQYEWSSMYHGHQFSLDDIDVLKTGDLLINLKTPLEIDGREVTRAVITTTGELVCYVDKGATVTGNAIFTGDKFYDFSGNVVKEVTDRMKSTESYDKEENNNDSYYTKYEWTVKGSFAGGIVWEGRREQGEKTYYKTYVMVCDEAQANQNVKWTGSKKYDKNGYADWHEYSSRVIEVKDTYMVLYDEDDEVYSVYDKYLERVFQSSNIPTVAVYDESIVITIGSDNKQVYEILVTEDYEVYKNEDEYQGGKW